MVKLRFMRIGKKNRPHYRLCAMDSRRPRDGQYIEWLGVYDPLILDDTKKIVIDRARAEYWLSVGAQPSETVRSFLKQAEVRGLVKLSKPKHKRPRAAMEAGAAPTGASHSGASHSEMGAAAASARKPKPPKKPRPTRGGSAQPPPATS